MFNTFVGVTERFFRPTAGTAPIIRESNDEISFTHSSFGTCNKSVDNNGHISRDAWKRRIRVHFIINVICIDLTVTRRRRRQ